MSKDKKQEANQGKELSEWQKRNLEYLKKKAEEEAALAEEKEKERKLRMGENSKKEEKTEEFSTESDEEKEEITSEKADGQEEMSAEESDKKTEEPTSEKSEEAVEERAEDSKAKAKKKEKPVKPKIARVHILRAVTVMVPSVLVFVFSAYLLTPFATIKNIEVKGNVQTKEEEIKEASGIADTDYTFALLLNKEKHADRIKSNHWIESAKIDYQFPTNFTIEVKEFEIVAFYVTGENHYPILSSGVLDSTPMSLVNLPETYLSVMFNDEQQIKDLVSGLSEISSEIKQSIEKIELAPSNVTADLLKITMKDTDEILVPLSELSKKLPYYGKIKPQLSEPSVVDMEAGIYSYSLADKLLEEAEKKAKEQAKAAEKQKEKESDEKPQEQ